jgi:nitrosocyanin
MGKLLMTLAMLLGFAAADHYAHSQKTGDKDKGANVKEFAMVNLEYEGTKIWLPSLIVVKKGDRVRIKLINNVPSGEHGFAITEFNVVDKVFKGEPRTVEFTADKAGIYKIFCQIHPAHIGAQLMVTE